MYGATLHDTLSSVTNVSGSARLRALGAGEGDSLFGAAIRENSSRGSEKRVDNLGNGELHRPQGSQINRTRYYYY